ncbi:hypothetical protein B0H14DRAFT_2587122 [Mycena olivaceomarginata]|nr:hypothetical protein B0H14DRAFT_2587122 [Mycena olivaceomarginata]
MELWCIADAEEWVVPATQSARSNEMVEIDAPVPPGEEIVPPLPRLRSLLGALKKSTEVEELEATFEGFGDALMGKTGLKSFETASESLGNLKTDELEPARLTKLRDAEKPRKFSGRNTKED